MSNKETLNKPVFTKDQLEYLETIFPVVVHSCNATENQLRHYNGQQSVVEFVRSKTVK